MFTGVNTTYFTSFFLTYISHFLLLESYTVHGQEIDTPLAFRSKKLVEKIEEDNFTLKMYEFAKNYSETTEEDDLYANNRFKSRLSDLQAEFEYVNQLISDEASLNKELNGAFPFAKRNLCSTFISSIKNISEFSSLSQQNITKKLREIQRHLRSYKEVNDEITRLMHFFEIDIKYSINKQKYLVSTIKSLQTQISKLIGEEANEEQIKFYKTIHPEFQNETNEVIINHVNSYIDNNAGKIVDTMTNIAKYMLNSEYLDYIRDQPFLTQVMVHRQISRDLQKTLLVEGNIDQISIPPGLNSTLKITASGSATVFVGELGSYKDIGNTYTVTLENYKNYFSKPGVTATEREIVFKTLHQVESIRNASTLITLPMFFELASVGFHSIRCDGYKYNFIEIDVQMPVAMEGAVSASIFLNNALSGLLPYDLPYDYRAIQDHKKGAILDYKNKILLFDYILFKSEICNKVIVFDENCRQKQYDSENGKYCFILEKIDSNELINKDFQVIGIKKFPIDIIKDLMVDWYKIDVPECTGLLKLEDSYITLSGEGVVTEDGI